MILTPTAEQQALSTAAEQYLRARWSVDRTRQALDGQMLHDDEVAGELAEMGWTSLLVDPEYGGGGADFATACVLLEQLGKHLAPCDVTQALLASSVVDTFTHDTWRKRILTEMCNGAAVVAVATDQHGRSGPELAVVESGSGDTLRVTIIRAWAAVTPRTTHVLLPCVHGGRCWLVVPVDTGGLKLTVLRRLDALPVSSISGHDLELPADHMVTQDQATAGVAGVQELGALFAAADLIGVTAALLERTRDYAMTRQQFGRAIGAFQAVSHRLADMLVDLEIGRSLVAAAAHACDTAASDRSMAVSAAKAWTSDAAVRAAEAAVQLHGGIGFTWESDIHLYLRRARAQAASFGTARHHKQLMAAGLSAWANATQ